MALIFTDGFDMGDHALKYGPNSVYNFSTWSAATRYNYGHCMVGGSSSKYFQLLLPQLNKIIFGYAYRDTTASTQNPLLSFWGDNRLTAHMTLQINTSRTFSLIRGGVTIATSTATLDSSWHFIEMSCTVSDTVGNVVVRLDGTQIINFTGDTKNGGTNTTIDGVNIANNAGQTIDDIYVLDDSGTTNNAFLGEIRIQTLSPNGAGSASQFTPTPTAANYTTVNEVPYSTANYVSSSTVGHRDLYAMDDLLAGTASVYGIQTNLIANKTDAGSGNIKTIIKSGASVYSDAAVSLSPSTAHFYKTRDTDPATSGSWTTSSVNSLEAGIENV